VKEIKYLGICFDSRLTFVKHIENSWIFHNANIYGRQFC
jgi:hypothetical protein